MRTCVICGQQDEHVVPSLALLRATSERDQAYTRMDRCNDRLACRDRCEAVGDSWPLALPLPPENALPALGEQRRPGNAGQLAQALFFLLVLIACSVERVTW